MISILSNYITVKLWICRKQWQPPFKGFRIISSSRKLRSAKIRPKLESAHCSRILQQLQQFTLRRETAIRTTVVVHGFDRGFDLDLKSFLQTGFLIELEGKIWIWFKSNILNYILDFFPAFEPGLNVWASPSSARWRHRVCRASALCACAFQVSLKCGHGRIIFIHPSLSSFPQEDRIHFHFLGRFHEPSLRFCWLGLFESGIIILQIWSDSWTSSASPTRPPTRRPPAAPPTTGTASATEAAAAAAEEEEVQQRRTPLRRAPPIGCPPSRRPRPTPLCRAGLVC